MIKIIIKLVLISTLLFKFAYAEKIIIFEFTDIELESLEVRKVRGADNKTEYSLGSNENGNYLKAIADNKNTIPICRPSVLSVYIIAE